jgi:hypothetical protein
MPRSRQIRPDAEVAVYGRVQPFLVNGGQTIKTLSAAFLIDLEEDWRAHGKRIFPILREKYPQAYFSGLVALSKIMRMEDLTVDLDRGLTPDEIMAKLEQRVGPEGKRLFEKFMKDVNKLQMKRLALEQAAEDDAGEDRS